MRRARARNRRREAFGLLVSLLLLAAPGTSNAVPGLMTTFAGGLGDGAPPTIARLFRPGGVAADAAGNVYISDTGNHRIRKIDVRGIISTIAGTGAASFSGDKDLAVKARLNRPSGLVFDSLGNVYIADTGNNRIRVVSQAGVITTFAGDGVRSFSGDKDLATVARLNAPTAVATAVAASSSGALPQAGPGATKDAPGVLVYIADTGNNRIRRVDTTGKITTFAGTGVRGLGGDGGDATRALLNAPHALMFDANGTLFVVDTGNHRIRAITSAGTIRTTAGTVRGFAGDGSVASSARFSSPTSIALGRNSWLVTDTLNNRVRAFFDGGYVATIAGSRSDPLTGDGGHALSAALRGPTVTATGPGGVVYIADTGNHRIRRVASNGLITTVAGTGAAGFSGDGGSAMRARLNSPQGLAVDRGGNLYFADTMNHRIRKVDRRGIITTVAGGIPGFAGDGKPSRYARLLVPTGLAMDAAGTLFIADTANNRIRKINTRGVISTVAGNGAKGYAGEGRNALGAALNLPFGVAVDRDGNVLVADTFNHRIRVVGTTGIITTLAGTRTRGYVGDGGPASMAQLNTPFGVAVDGGNVYIADSGNRRIRVVTADDVIVTLAGNGTATPTPDGIPAPTSTLVTPLHVTMLGNFILVPDAGEHRVRYFERTPAA